MSTEIATQILKLNHLIYEHTGVVNALEEIRVSPEVFNLMVVDAHKLPLSQEDERNGAMRASMFKPSDAYAFQLCGVKISPNMAR